MRPHISEQRLREIEEQLVDVAPGVPLDAASDVPDLVKEIRRLQRLVPDPKPIAVGLPKSAAACVRCRQPISKVYETLRKEPMCWSCKVLRCAGCPTGEHAWDECPGDHGK